MRALAGELKHSETAFVRRTGRALPHPLFHPRGGGGSLRPRHHRLLHRPAGDGGHRAGDVCPAHPLRRPVHPGGRGRGVDGHGPRRRPELSEEEQAELYAAYGLSLADRPEGLEAQAVSTGLLDILLPVRDLAALERAEQNEGRSPACRSATAWWGCTCSAPAPPTPRPTAATSPPCTPSRRRRPPAPPTGR